MNIEKAIKRIKEFQGNSLTESLAQFECDIIGHDSITSHAFCNEHKINNDFMTSALSIKIIAGQINTIIHAAGILQSLSAILEEGETVESVSLGAGNTGKKFDLETNLRVAEFKFIDWKGGAESIRQNGIFKDFYELAEHKTDKKKTLYVVNTTHPLKFFNSSRALTSVLSKQPKILTEISINYDNKLKVVNDYYSLHKDNVQIIDIGQHIGR
jgi:hypothetical protein